MGALPYSSVGGLGSVCEGPSVSPGPLGRPGRASAWPAAPSGLCPPCARLRSAVGLPRAARCSPEPVSSVFSGRAQSCVLRFSQWACAQCSPRVHDSYFHTGPGLRGARAGGAPQVLCPLGKQVGRERRTPKSVPDTSETEIRS